VGAVDLDGIKLSARMFQFPPLRKLFRIKNAAPAFIGPTGNSNVEHPQEVRAFGTFRLYENPARQSPAFDSKRIEKIGRLTSEIQKCTQPWVAPRYDGRNSHTMDLVSPQPFFFTSGRSGLPTGGGVRLPPPHSCLTRASCEKWRAHFRSDAGGKIRREAQWRATGDEPRLQDMRISRSCHRL
jgi:hypothetical protein